LENEKHKDVPAYFKVKAQGSKVDKSLVFQFVCRMEQGEGDTQEKAENYKEWSGEQKVAYMANLLPTANEERGKTLAELYEEHYPVLNEMEINSTDTLRQLFHRHGEKFVSKRGALGQATIYYQLSGGL